MDNIIYEQGTATVVIPATESIAVSTRGEATVHQVVGFPNVPDQETLLGTVVNGTSTFGAFAAGATVVIRGGAAVTLYNVGVAPAILSDRAAQVQPTPVAVNVTGAVSAAALLGGIVTSTTAAAVAGTIPTGTVMEAAAELAINDSFDWCVINTGGNAFTVTAAADHTIVGVAVVAATSSGLFRTRKTAAGVFVTYRLG